ncbi:MULTISPECIES: cytidine deaminase [Leuconostoc]|uniref:cytidine deaminase n=1 Tax=Leuconostoc TaxID=1243 RepID=UPI0021AABDD6|nr:cytidine deaminase [Leuconostoc pseudomesenteroides]MCT4388781.1 cytidine deaminase [Leuconostoc pseudomesenteroides]
MQKNTSKLFDSISKTIDKHYPEGWGGAAGVLLENGDILTSISPEFPNAASSVCMELGSYIQAATLDQKITHTLCLVRENEHDSLTVLTPCGICQERLNFWGNTTQCGIEILPNGEIHYISLADLQPFHWSRVYQ